MSYLPSPPPPPPPALSVAVSGDLILTLPRNRTTVFANTWPEPRFHEQFSYQWEKLAGPGPGQWSGETGSTLGLYEVRGDCGISLTQTLRGPKEKLNLLKVPFTEIRYIYKHLGTSNAVRVSHSPLYIAILRRLRSHLHKHALVTCAITLSPPPLTSAAGGRHLPVEADSDGPALRALSWRSLHQRDGATSSPGQLPPRPCHQAL